MVLAENIKHIHIPQYDTLKLDKILDLAEKHPNILEKLPTKIDEVKKFPKPYICDLIYTMEPVMFKKWVTEQINNRHDGIKTNNNLVIKMDPKIA